MSQYRGNRNSGSGRSRSRANTGSRGSSAARRSTSSRTASARRNTRSGARRRPRRNGPDFDFVKLAVGGVILILAIACIVFLVKGMSKPRQEEETTEIVVEETELQKEVTVDGINITGMSRDEARQVLNKKFSWDMKIIWEDRTYEVADLMASKIEILLNEIYGGEPRENYTIDTSGLEDLIKDQVSNVAAQWNQKAKNGSISEYDASSDSFRFSGAEEGWAVDQEKLVSDIQAALDRKEFDAVIAAVVNPVQPEFSEAAAKEKYKTLASFTTDTTANSKRNTNIKLAAQKINGLVLQPGEEFSFNDVVGERTEAKGYQGAAAYNNGEVVQEIGGGVCQVSSTLYNAVVKAGLKTTYRRSHTYEPSYVIPGTDATISWGGPDYKFVNNSSAAIGLKASYYNQKVTVSIYGVPVLEDGVTYSLKSTKIKEIDPPAPVYEEDPTLEPGVEKIKSSGSKGSRWETRLVVSKNGEVISQDVDHTVTYRGHAPVILRNTSGSMAVVAPSLEDSTAVDPLNPSTLSIETEEGSAGTMPTSPTSGASSSASPAPSVTPTPAETTKADMSSAPISAMPAPAPPQNPGSVTNAPGSMPAASLEAPAPGSNHGNSGGPGSDEESVIIPPNPGN